MLFIYPVINLRQTAPKGKRHRDHRKMQYLIEVLHRSLSGKTISLGTFLIYISSWLRTNHLSKR